MEPKRANTIAVFLREGKRADWALFLLIAMVGVGGFLIGRYSGTEATAGPGVAIYAVPGGPSDFLASPEESAPSEAPKPSAVAGNAGAVASKSGEVYYLPWCKGQNRIKEENKVRFSSEAAAVEAGYRKAANCK